MHKKVSFLIYGAVFTFNKVRFSPQQAAFFYKVKVHKRQAEHEGNR